MEVERTEMFGMYYLKSQKWLLTCDFAKVFDTYATLKVKRGLKDSRARLRGLGRSIVLMTLITAISFIPLNSSSAYTYHKMNLKLYAFNALGNWDQMECYNILIQHESSWNYKARNGNHYGLGQMANAMVLRLNPNQQIDLHIKYIKHRYGVDHQGYVNACKALRFFEVNHYH
jgi:hypothetical protein